MLRRVGLVAVCVAASLFPPAVASAEDQTARGAARSLGYSGVEDYQKGRYAPAADKLERAYSVIRAPALGLWSARSLSKLGKLVEAAERYLEVTRLDVNSGEIAVQKQAQADAAAERAELLPRIPSLVVSLEGATSEQVTVTVDGKQVPPALIGAKLPMNPGSHRVEVTGGEAKVSREVTLVEAQAGNVTVPIQLAAGGPPPPPEAVASQDTGTTTTASSGMQRTVGWVVLAVGGAGLAVSGVSAGLALKSKSDFDDQCESSGCNPDVRGDVDRYSTLRTLSTVTFAAGLVGVGSGLVLLFTAPSKESATANVRPWVGVASAGISGAF